jgi:hypothetical protein
MLDHADPNLQQVYVDPTICPEDRATMPPLDLTDPPIDSIGQGPESAA